ncbi:type VI secretion system amidase effector protein Tae4 [Helicobacter cinaedi]|nr:type VI secretion system amidase effector protein Tae4 [Helicobacter cinaedi]
MTSKDKNQRFFKELQSLNRKGVVSMIGTGGLRHTTLWNGNDFLDTALGISVNYLDDTTDLIRELYFWDLI